MKYIIDEVKGIIVNDDDARELRANICDFGIGEKIEYLVSLLSEVQSRRVSSVQKEQQRIFDEGHITSILIEIFLCENESGKLEDDMRRKIMEVVPKEHLDKLISIKGVVNTIKSIAESLATLVIDRLDPKFMTVAQKNDFLGHARILVDGCREQTRALETDLVGWESMADLSNSRNDNVIVDELRKAIALARVRSREVEERYEELRAHYTPAPTRHRIKQSHLATAYIHSGLREYFETAHNDAANLLGQYFVDEDGAEFRTLKTAIRLGFKLDRRFSYSPQHSEVVKMLNNIIPPA